MDPQQLKKRYIANIEQVTINQEIEKLTIDSPEVVQIRKEKEKAIEEKEFILDNIEKIIDERLENASNCAKNKVDNILKEYDE